MKLVLTALLSLVFFTSSAFAKVEFLKEAFDQAVKQSQRTKKPLMVDFFTTWCGPCKMMEKSTFVDHNVTILSKNFICVQLDGDKAENKLLMKKWDVAGFPTFLFLSPQGKEIDKYSGYVNALEFTRILRDVAANRNTYIQIVDAYNKAPHEPDTAFQMANKYFHRGDYKKAEPLFQKVIGLDPRGEKGPYADEARLVLARLSFQKRQPEKAESFLKAILDREPPSEKISQAGPMLASLYSANKEPQKALDLYHSLLQRAPENKEILGEYGWFCTQTKMERDKAIKRLEGTKGIQKDARLLEILAQLYYSKENYDAAVTTLEKVAQLVPNNQELLGKLTLFKRTRDKANSTDHH